MYLNRMWVENYRIFSERQEYRPGRGHNLIIGGNGEGKSSIMRAHRLLFFADAATNLEEEIHGRGSYFSLGADFVLGGQEGRITFRYERKGKSGTSLKELIIGADVFRNSDAVAELKRRYNFELGLTASYSCQDEQSLILAGKAERREMLKEVYCLNFDREVENVQRDEDLELAEIQKEMGKVEALRGLTFTQEVIIDPKLSREEALGVSKQIEELVERQKEREGSFVRVAEKRKAIHEHNRKRLSLAERLASLRQEKLGFEEKRRLVEAQKESKAWEAEREALEAELAALKYIRPIPVAAFDVAKLEGARVNFDDARQEYLAACSRRSDYENQCKLYFASRESLESRRKAIQAKGVADSVDLNGLESVYRDCVVKVSRRESEYGVLQEKSKSLASGVCPVCGKPFEAHDGETLRAEIEGVRVDLEACRRDLAAREKDLELGREVEKKRGLILKQLGEVELLLAALVEPEEVPLPESGRMEFLRDELNSVQAEYADWKVKDGEYQGKVAEDRETEKIEGRLKAGIVLVVEKREGETKRLEMELVHLADMLERHVRDISGIETELGGMEEMSEDAVASDLARIQGELDGIGVELAEKRGVYEEYLEVNRRNVFLRERNERVKAAERDTIEKIDKHNLAIAEKREVINTLERVRVILQREFPAYVLSKLVRELGVALNGFVDQVYHKDLGVEISEAKGGVDIRYTMGGRSLDVVHLSGAERQILTMAYKSALNARTGLGFLWLDEVDSNLMEEQALKLLGVIRELSVGVYEQVFQVSHVEAVKEQAILGGSTVWEVRAGEILSIS